VETYFLLTLVGVFSGLPMLAKLAYS
jgi:hypothetical protein